MSNQETMQPVDDMGVAPPQDAPPAEYVPPAEARQVAGFYIDLTSGFPEMRIVWQGDQDAPRLTSDLIARAAASVNVLELESEALDDFGLGDMGTVGQRTLAGIVHALHAHLYEHEQSASG